LFSNQNPSFGTFWKPFERKISISFLLNWNTLWPFDLFHGNLVHTCFGNSLKYPHFGILCQDKSGNPDLSWMTRKRKIVQTQLWKLRFAQKIGLRKFDFKCYISTYI
jgi:hypothetical protein